ncbi:hypothetical protein [Pseudomonas atagonensis]|uniref:hypothetical protein n=1 Tax=Pseudomonas atagonensis TaxID=2609964 RepID=UPI00140B561E|nr:hypothetical protein [Pseudomonas atagonensis]
MPAMQNVVAVDWRSGRDCIFFFFKDTDTYSRFNIADDEVPDGYPRIVGTDRWGAFAPHAPNIRFGFTTTDLLKTTARGADDDTLWLFYVDGDTPMVCEYDQDSDRVIRTDPLENTLWKVLIPYFDRIIAGVWWDSNSRGRFRFILSDGNSLEMTLDPSSEYDGLSEMNFTYYKGDSKVQLAAISETTWPGITPYKDRIITAVQNDRSFADSRLYIFLTDNEYLAYNIPENQLEYGPKKVDNATWPGLLRD